MSDDDLWRPIAAAAAELAARAAERAFREALHPERDPFALTPRALRAAPDIVARREAFRRAHAAACVLRDDTAAA